MRQRVVCAVLSIVAASVVFVCSVVLVTYWMLRGGFHMGWVVYFAVARGVGNWVLYAHDGPRQLARCWDDLATWWYHRGHPGHHVRGYDLLANALAGLSGLTLGGWVLHSYLGLIMQGQLHLPAWVAVTFSLGYAVGFFIITRQPLAERLPAWRNLLTQGPRALLHHATWRHALLGCLALFGLLGSLLLAESKHLALQHLLTAHTTLPHASVSLISGLMVVVGYLGLMCFTLEQAGWVTDALCGRHPPLRDAWTKRVWAPMALTLVVLVGDALSNVGILVGSHGTLSHNLGSMVTNASSIYFGVQAILPALSRLWLEGSTPPLFPTDPRAFNLALTWSTTILCALITTYLGWYHTHGAGLPALPDHLSPYVVWWSVGALVSLGVVAGWSRPAPSSGDRRLV